MAAIFQTNIMMNGSQLGDLITALKLGGGDPKIIEQLRKDRRIVLETIDKYGNCSGTASRINLVEE